MTFPERFIQQLKKYSFIQPQHKQLLAISGGVDSVVLADLMYKAGYDFMVAHCNFQLRGEESERDEQFVRKFAAGYDKTFLVKRFETEKFAAANKLSIQVAARQLRYSWFSSIVQQKEEAVCDGQVQYIVTAHHANDQVETMLMNFFKGTGITGLHGILPLKGKLFRPLLFARKEEILQYAKENSLQFVEDSSNLTDKYTRNFFRHRLFPLLKEIYPAVEENLIKNIERFTETEELYKEAITQHKKKLLETKGNERHIPILKLLKTTSLKTVLYEIIKDFGFASTQVEEVMDLFESDSGKYVASKNYRIIKNRKWLIISPVQSIESSVILIEEGDKVITFQKGELHIERVSVENFHLSTDKNIAALDSSTISFPLILRQWKQGDYFYPLGMVRKKKVTRFLNDLKLSLTQKENIWVIEMNKKIIWVAGKRIDDRFKITPNSKNIIQITYLPK